MLAVVHSPDGRVSLSLPLPAMPFRCPRNGGGGVNGIKVAVDQISGENRPWDASIKGEDIVYSSSPNTSLSSFHTRRRSHV